MEKGEENAVFIDEPVRDHPTTNNHQPRIQFQVQANITFNRSLCCKQSNSNKKSNPRLNHGNTI